MHRATYDARSSTPSASVEAGTDLVVVVEFEIEPAAADALTGGPPACVAFRFPLVGGAQSSSVSAIEITPLKSNAVQIRTRELSRADVEETLLTICEELTPATTAQAPKLSSLSGFLKCNVAVCCPVAGGISYDSSVIEYLKVRVCALSLRF